MIINEDGSRDLAVLVVPLVGALRVTGDLWEPCQLLDPDGWVVRPVAEYLKDLQAGGRPASTQRSYAHPLLRWFRFCWAIEVGWDQATRVEARDFSRWIQITGKPVRSRERAGPAGLAGPDSPSAGRPAAGTPNQVTGKLAPARGYAPSTAAHGETVLRGFYAFHLEAGSGPMVNPFPLARGGRAHAHHNPMLRRDVARYE